jgi:uroporphyrinogen-III synthase
MTGRITGFGGPLAGWRIAVTRPRAVAGSLVRAIARLGGQPLATPLLRVVGPADPGPLAAALDRLDRYDWLVVTSAAAARAVADRGAPASLGRVRVAAVGPATAAALRSLGIGTDFLPGEFAGTTLGATISIQPGDRVLLPRSREATRELPDALRRRGAEVDEVEAYALAPDPDGARLRAALEAGAVDCLTLFSPSAVTALGWLGSIGGLPPVVTVGPVTSRAASAAGIRVTRVAHRYDEEGVVAGLIELAGTRALATTP